MPLSVAFFNLIFISGVLPDSWLEGVTWPIYENKGDSKSPENYRPITILSCLIKLFTFILNARLYDFIDTHTVIEENQTSFHAGFSTIDQIFCIACINRNGKNPENEIVLFAY